jgi:YidC/Oxa1 family membrane protein insertase
MFFISAFLKDILEYIVQFVGNYGWSVVVFTLVIRIALLPLDIKSKKSMRRMTELQPKMEVLQKKYANDKEKLNQKLSELYRKEKVNPMSSCLPMLLSMPILFCMWDAMRVVANEHTVKMLLAMRDGVFDPANMQSWLWIKNVFQPDSFMATIVPTVGDKLSGIAEVSGTLLTKENLDAVREFLTTPEYAAIAAQFGADKMIYSAPALFWTINIPAQFNGLFILPVLAFVSQYLTTKLTSAGQPQQQKQNAMMTWMFPIMSLFFCASYNAAFAIYWVAVNVFMLAQQVLLTWYYDKKSPKQEVVKA